MNKIQRCQIIRDATDRHWYVSKNPTISYSTWQPRLATKRIHAREHLSGGMAEFWGGRRGQGGRRHGRRGVEGGKYRVVVAEWRDKSGNVIDWEGLWTWLMQVDEVPSKQTNVISFDHSASASHRILVDRPPHPHPFPILGSVSM